MPMMSSPHDVEPLTLTRTSVPLPFVSAGRQRHSTFLASRISRSGPPTVRKRGVETVPPATFWPDLADHGRLPRLEVDPVDGLRRAIDDVRGAVGAADHRSQVDRRGAVGRREGEQGGRRDRDDPVQAVEAGERLLAQRRDDRIADARPPWRRRAAGRRRSAAGAPGEDRRRRGRSRDPSPWPGPTVAASIARWPALTELIASCGVPLPPKT